MKISNIFLSLIFVLIESVEMIGSPWSVSLSLGKIRNLQPNVPDLSKYAVFPEIQFERGLFNIEKNIITFNGALYFSWWDDFVDEPTTHITDNFTYSYQLSTVGTRLLINLGFWKIRNSIFIGLSENYIKAEVVGGSGAFSGDVAEDHNDFKLLYQYGFNISYLITKRIHIGYGWIKEFSRTCDLCVNPRYGNKIYLSYNI